MGGYRRLEIWKKSHSLTLEIYRITKEFPENEKFGLVSQMTRAASSIPSNIAEGYGNIHLKIFQRHLGIARGSAYELEYQLLLAKDLNYIDKEEYEKINAEIVELKKMLTGFIKSVISKIRKSQENSI